MPNGEWQSFRSKTETLLSGGFVLAPHYFNEMGDSFISISSRQTRFVSICGRKVKQRFPDPRVRGRVVAPQLEQQRIQYIPGVVHAAFGNG